MNTSEQFIDSFVTPTRAVQPRGLWSPEGHGTPTPPPSTVFAHRRLGCLARRSLALEKTLDAKPLEGSEFIQFEGAWGA